MIKLFFNIADSTKKDLFNIETYEKARNDLKKYENLFASYPSITGSWVGSRMGELYFMLVVKKGEGSKLEKIIPDKLDNYYVYYIEGDNW